MTNRPLHAPARSLLAAAVALTIAAVAAPPATAAVGDFTQILCADPETGRGLGVSRVDGLTTPASEWTWKASVGPAQCGAAPTTADRAITLGPRHAEVAADGEYAAINYALTKPGITLRGATLYRTVNMAPSPTSPVHVAQHGGEDPSITTSPLNEDDEHSAFYGSVVGDPSRPFDAINALAVRHYGPYFAITASCWENSGCPSTEGEWNYRVFGGRVRLRDTTSPAVRSVSGSLASDPRIRSGVLSFRATDVGAGVYRFKLSVDGAQVDARLLSSDRLDIDGTTPEETCLDVNTTNTDPYEFAHQQPCPLSVERTVSWSASGIPDGTHRLRAVVEDAGGNEAVLVDRQVIVDNVPDPQSARPTAGPANAAAHPAATPAAPSPTSPLARIPQPNGRGATPDARLALNGSAARRSIRTRYTARPVLTGRLTDRRSRPIAGARVVITERYAEPGASSTEIGTAMTEDDGRWRYTAGAGPSRALDVAYRATDADTLPAARATARFVVPAAVSLRVGPARVGRRTILTGRLTHLPRAGIKLEVQALDGRTWRTFDTTMTRAGGAYRYAYRFKRAAAGRIFAMRVLVDSPVYPFARAASKPARVRVR